MRASLIPKTTGTSTSPIIGSSIPGIPGVAFASTGPVELKSAVSPMGKFIGTTFVCAIWNGITSVFVAMAVKSWLNARPEWFLTIFMIPFVAIGLGALGYTGWMFLNLFNPRIRMMVNSRAVPLGGSFEVNWAFKGSPSRISRLSIVLVGREEATYRRGTDTSTDKAVFFEMPLTDTTDRMQIPQGNARIQIPAGLMHSWASSNNKVIWLLKVNGEIPRFPDIEEEFEISVLPGTAHKSRQPLP